MPTNPFKRSIMLPPSLLSYTQPHFMSVAEAVLRKRKRSSREACEADDNPLSSSKRPKTDDSIRQARRAARERFWDTLSKVWLTPRALREFDRRNAAQSLEQRCTSNLGLRSRKRSFIDTSHLSAASLKDLKRFARRGGPSLVDLRSVSQVVNYYKDKCLHTNLLVSRTITSVLQDHELCWVQLQEPETVKQVKQSFLYLRYRPDS